MPLHTCTKMACWMSETKFYQIEMIRGYNHLSFIENLKEIMLYAGVEGKQIAFCLVDTQIVDESFLEDVNNILNTGQVPNMFASDEYNKICEDLRPIMKKDGIDTRDGLRKAFLNRVRTNLHIVLCHSPVGDALRVRCRFLQISAPVGVLTECATEGGLWYTTHANNRDCPTTRGRAQPGRRLRCQKRQKGRSNQT